MTRQDELCFELQRDCDAAQTGERCSECRAYARLFEAHDSRSDEALPVSVSLPPGLTARLQSIPEDFEHTDRLYVSALAGEPLEGRIPPGEEDNPGRRAAHDALAVTFAEARRNHRLPPRLRDKLRAIPRRRAAEQLPFWLADSRWATAACLMLTSMLGLAAGDASARFAQTTALVQEAPALLKENPLLTGPPLEAGENLRKAGDSLEHEWSTWKLSASQTWLEAMGLADARGKELSQSLQGKALESFDTAANRSRQAFETLENSEPIRWMAGLFQQGDDDE